MLDVPNMLLIGAAERNAGKTTFAVELIRRFIHLDILAAKATVVKETSEMCPRGGEGCGVCSSLSQPFIISEEQETTANKDTSRLLAAGARRVFWLRVLREHLAEGAKALADSVGTHAPCICESNSLRLAVNPGMFFMVTRSGSSFYKSSALLVLPYVNETIDYDGNNFSFDFDRIAFCDGRWVMR